MSVSSILTQQLLGALKTEIPIDDGKTDNIEFATGRCDRGQVLQLDRLDKFFLISDCDLVIQTLDKNHPSLTLDHSGNPVWHAARRKDSEKCGAFSQLNFGDFCI